ncbi:hypothetical protein NQ318_020147 [Aromia moschata]|uniref:Sodium/potassium/calcium exchanger 5 n=1 Tax=Aromia moschata TaxID=1265417 RepID=A0AAV8ZBX3_9CUCU|nr:hypothetical protein NQ318_020147 [Aromia moschata]
MTAAIRQNLSPGAPRTDVPYDPTRPDNRTLGTGPQYATQCDSDRSRAPEPMIVGGSVTEGAGVIPVIAEQPRPHHGLRDAGSREQSSDAYGLFEAQETSGASITVSRRAFIKFSSCHSRLGSRTLHELRSSTLLVGVKDTIWFSSSKCPSTEMSRHYKVIKTQCLFSGLNCTPPAIDDFPKDLFTEKQRRAGAIAVHIFISLYLFVALAVVCDKFFVPAVDKICHALNMTADVAGATFMAAATSAPELFVNVIGTFITEGDIGVGTIVGSAVFNILAVAACCGIGAGMCGVKVVPLDWWPLTRDCLAYGITVSILICIIHDERVEWYEALCLVLLYIVYILIMYFDKSIQKCVRGNLNRNCNDFFFFELSPEIGSTLDPKGLWGFKRAVWDVYRWSLPKTRISGARKTWTTTRSNSLPPVGEPVYVVGPPAHLNGSLKSPATEQVQETEEVNKADAGQADEEEPQSLWKWPKGRGAFTQATWIVTWPIHLVFLFTIPDCEKPRFKKWFPLTFIMCIVWIGSLSYAVAWMITIIGDTLKIPDSVMGITFLAAGTSVPEAVSSVIVAKQGHGSMGISNSIGSNTFDILLCLGLPWFIKATFLPTIAGKHWVGINSAGIEYSAISLLSTLLLLYVAFALNKFQLDKRVGRVCLLMYAVFLILATLIELNAFFRVNLPTCQRR